MGNRILKSLRVALLNPVNLVTNNNVKDAMLSTLHDVVYSTRTYRYNKNLCQNQKTLLLERNEEGHNMLKC